MTAHDATVRAGLAALGLACFAVCYYGPAVLPAAGLAFDPALPVDAMLPCVPAMAGVYVAGVFWPLALAGLTPHALLGRVAGGFGLVSAISAALFALLPTDGSVLRAQCTPAAGDALAVLHRLDPPVHLFPSLHVGYALYTALCIGLALPHWRGAAMAMAIAQAIAVCLVKQHYLADAAAGAVIAVIAYRLAVAPSGTAGSGRPSQPWASR